MPAVAGTTDVPINSLRPEALRTRSLLVAWDVAGEGLHDTVLG